MEADSPVRDTEYLKGLREAVSRGVEYGIEVLVASERLTPAAPLPLVSQARLAARQGIDLDMVVRRYLVAKTLLGEFMLAEAARIGLDDLVVIRDLLAAHERALDHILTQATTEYQREIEAAKSMPDFRVADCVRRLLEGEPVDTTLLNYDLELNHLGLVILAPDAKPQLRQLAKTLGGRLLSVTVSQSVVWAWIGTGEPVDPAEITNWAKAGWSDSAPLGIGEPAAGPNGWRKSHGQARAAAQLAAMASGSSVRYRDIALLTTAARDPLFLASVAELYLRPLGPKDRETLRAYFRAGSNGSTAAAVLGVTRQTVAKRLEAIEEQIGQPVAECADVLHTALRLEALGLVDAA